MELNEIVLKLVGHIDVVGESNYDYRSHENMKQLTVLISDLLDEVSEVAKHHNSYNHSMKIQGEFACKFLKDLKENID